jgi:D-alanyl-lipoteichoic acid acyltransferase DltB (MBOAT superfamily)
VLFNSVSFIWFLGLVLALYYCLEQKWQNRMLLVASYVFYAAWDWRFLGLIWFITLTSYLAGLVIGRSGKPAQRKAALATVAAACLLPLGFYKYYNFFIHSFAHLISIWGLSASLPTLSIILPVGISFYTFQALGYVIDVYRRKQEPESDPLIFALYMAYFPHLVAGPIQRADHLIPALRSRRAVCRSDIGVGLELMLVGYVRKVAIADAVAPYVNACFAAPQDTGGLNLLFGLYLFAIQIYGDFAGYTDIARGMSRLMGINLMINFRQPYFSTSMQDFWRRWHISLSSWLRDYLYISLGGNRHGTVQTIRNLLLTMLLGGLWHGASWTFVIWGGLHGLYLSAERLIHGARAPEEGRSLWKVLKIVATFHLVVFTWLFFRADSLTAAMDYLASMMHLGARIEPHLLALAVFYCLLTAVIDYPLYQANTAIWPIRAQKWVTRGLSYGAIAVILLFLGETHAEPFIYFQF